MKSFPTSDVRVGWGDFRPGAPVKRISDLKPGDYILSRTNRFSGSKDLFAHNVMVVVSGDETGFGRPLIRARMVEPKNPRETRAGAADSMTLWDFEVTSAFVGSPEYFHTTVPAELEPGSIPVRTERKDLVLAS